jgi:hypothetical protein
MKIKPQRKNFNYIEIFKNIKILNKCPQISTIRAELMKIFFVAQSYRKPSSHCAATKDPYKIF